MPRPRRNPFYVVLGVVGFVFTITATSYCVSVLRGVRPALPDAEPSAFEALMDRHGTALLTGELVILAIATVGAVGLDHVEGERQRAARAAERARQAADRGPADDTPGGAS
jgi:uncharacterized membrane protein